MSKYMNKERPLAPSLSSINLEDHLFKGTNEEYMTYLKEVRGRVGDSNPTWAKIREASTTDDTDQPKASTPAPDYEPSEGNPFGDRAWDVYSDAVAQIESGGKYNIQGGYNSHYDGKYQMGRVAKVDAARRLGITLGHSAEDRQAYLADPDLQERAFEAFTMANHDTLSRSSEVYRGMTKQEQLSILAYAHNQGAGGALDYLRTGKAGADGFGTNAQKYVDAVKTRFGGAG